MKPLQHTQLTSIDLPQVAIVGRPNVGKSTLFNRLVGKRLSIVREEPGVTRDRQFGNVKWRNCTFQLSDSAGVDFQSENALQKKMTHQSMMSMDDADLVIVLMDGRAGVTAQDREWIAKVRKISKPKLYVINKIDNQKDDELLNEFYELGIDKLWSISSESSRRIGDLLDEVVNILSQTFKVKRHDQVKTDFSLAIIGRPNVGKSSLLNALWGDERVVVDETPGTTRDPIDVSFEYEGSTYKIIDTAGIRRRGRVEKGVELFSVKKSVAMIKKVDAVLFVIDCIEGVTDQDAKVLGEAFKLGKLIMILMNKWDEASKTKTKEEVLDELERKMRFATFCPYLFISAKTHMGIQKIMPQLASLRQQYEKRIPTSQLNKAFEKIIAQHNLPVHKGKNIRMYYATQIGERPPTFVVFSNKPKDIHFSYQRYLTNCLKEEFNLKDIPIKIIFRQRKSKFDKPE